VGRHLSLIVRGDFGRTGKGLSAIDFFDYAKLCRCIFGIICFVNNFGLFWDFVNKYKPVCADFWTAEICAGQEFVLIFGRQGFVKDRNLC
jgi:hypothetical protein